MNFLLVHNLSQSHKFGATSREAERSYECSASQLKLVEASLGMTQKSAYNMLDQIAQALGVPVDALHSKSLSCGVSPEAQAMHEMSELLNAFAHVTSPDARRLCIEFVHSSKGE